jgi:UDP-N-acetylmuramoyl-tripeptide--D-alanyl-D-alanine ligase
MIWGLAVACALATVPAGLRWLRVAQREHYLAGSVTRFQDRWWLKSGKRNRSLFVARLTGFAASFLFPWAAFSVPVISAIAPLRLSVRGRSSPLAWTPRLVRVAVLSGVLVLAVLAAGVFFDLAPLVLVPVMFLPQLVDLALFCLRPLEHRLGDKWVEQAKRKLAAVGPEVVAITGSYGKTSTKGYVTHLLSGSRRVVASPASFNNRMGLARAINEHLAPGTQVFVAEMGTYGPGEIAELCGWLRPRVSALISIGPVHLERFKNELRIVEAKSEILDGAEVGVICVDHPLLSRLAGNRSASMEILEVGTGERGRVRVVDGALLVDGVRVADVPSTAYPANLAVAVGISLALGLDIGDIAGRIGDLPVADHRLTATTSDLGFTIIDDTYNSNPAGARRALARLAETGTGRRVVVTPGMVELGSLQGVENRRFGEEASLIADELVLIGRTNRAYLLAGSSKGTASVTVVENRDDAVDWIRSNLGPGDAVLYENDLPDHYP